VEGSADVGGSVITVFFRRGGGGCGAVEVVWEPVWEAVWEPVVCGERVGLELWATVAAASALERRSAAEPIDSLDDLGGSVGGFFPKAGLLRGGGGVGGHGFGELSLCIGLLRVGDGGRLELGVELGGES
jgi:hypothetical protein